jgi:hypothetical protein
LRTAARSGTIVRIVGRYLRAAIWLAIVAGAVWFGATVPIGERTLFEHIRWIGHARDPAEAATRAQQLVDESKEAARPTIEKVGNKIAPPVAPSDDDRKWQKRSIERSR